MAGMEILLFVGQAAVTIVPTITVVCWRIGRSDEKVAQIEKRLNGDGLSVPSRCAVHGQKLDDHERRIRVFE